MNDFEQFMDQAWSDHAARAEAVAQALAERGARLSELGQIARFAQLTAHVFGEHLGQWQGGIDVIERLRELAFFEASSEAESSIVRTTSALRLAASGDRSRVEALAPSERGRVFALTVGFLVGRGDLARASEYYSQARTTIEALAPTDAAHRALAVCGNNLAAELETKAERSGAETELMLVAARTARKEWQLAGTWINVERAEYRLAKSLLAASLASEALEHAAECLELCRKHGAEPYERFWALECIAECQRALGNDTELATVRADVRATFEQLSESEQASCRATLEKLNAD